MRTTFGNMIFRCAVIFGIASSALAQNNVWLKLEKGDALVLLPKTAQWQPLITKNEIPRRTYLLTKEQSVVKIFVATEIYEVDENSYVFIEDVIAKSRGQLVAELTRIEAEQLPNPERKNESPNAQEVGLTYGKPSQSSVGDGNIPYRKERFTAINYFIKKDRPDAAVLTMKRMLTKYPSLYLDQLVVEQLFSLYERLELHGFLFDESNKLLSIIKNEEFSTVVMKWNKEAKKKLTGN